MAERTAAPPGEPCSACIGWTGRRPGKARYDILGAAGAQVPGFSRHRV